MKGLLTILTLMLLVGYTAPTPKNQSACEKAGMSGISQLLRQI